MAPAAATGSSLSFDCSAFEFTRIHLHKTSSVAGCGKGEAHWKQEATGGKAEQPPKQAEVQTTLEEEDPNLERTWASHSAPEISHLVCVCLKTPRPHTPTPREAHSRGF